VFVADICLVRECNITEIDGRLPSFENQRRKKANWARSKKSTVQWWAWETAGSELDWDVDYPSLEATSPAPTSISDTSQLPS